MLKITENLKHFATTFYCIHFFQLLVNLPTRCEYLKFVNIASMTINNYSHIYGFYIEFSNIIRDLLINSRWLERINSKQIIN